MATRPGPFPDWDLDEIDTAAPSALETDEGWALNQQPDRQVFNWFWNLKGRWVRWLDQTTRRAGIDLIENGGIIYNHTVLPAEFTGDPPTWGGTHSTTIPAAWFVAAAVLANDRVGPIDSPATALPDSSDVYVDLGFDGVWDFNAVANGAGAPGVAANHVRVLRFVTNGAAQITGGLYYRNGFRYVGLGTLIRTTAGLMLSASRGLTFDAVSDRSTVIHDGIVQGGNGDIGAITPETLAAKELLAGRAATVPGGLAGNDSHWWGLTVNARWTGTQWDRADASSDSYMFVLHERGFTLLRHPQAQAAPWANTLSSSTWVVLAQFGHTGTSVDEFGNLAGLNNVTAGGVVTAPIATLSTYAEVTGLAPATMPANARIYADTQIRAWGYIVSDGVGGINTQSGPGYTATIAGTAVRITFDQPFNSASDYAVSVLPASGTNAFPGYANKLADRIDILLRTDAGTGLDFSGSSYGFVFIATGRLA